ncbi:leucine-rich repeat neuronal protein 1-like [Uloborus diversus]|uniref:leucine-rich repeat neuronal protein 1-like n=1 Tax=Uloborus diversus TaxID=327109 RepID=UPI0024095041|nr:leucine-rich repeat neuronal protein 1-like [Uloborus diversus]
MRAARVLLLLLPPLLRPAAPSCPGPCACALPRTADCSGRGLSSVPRDIPPDLEALLLSDNQLTDLYGQLPELPDLQMLDLSSNQVKQLGRGLIFHNLGELRTLNLSYNDFRTVFNGVFRGIHKLRLLAMTHVQIKFIEEHVFDGLKELRRLHLSHNQLNAIFPEWFRDLGRLEELRLENNHISYVNSGTFSGLVALKRLSLSGNRIRGISEHAFDSLENLTTLDLEDNQLVKVPSASFKATKSIKVLKLGGNSFPQLQTGDFVHLSLEEAFVENIPELVLVDRGAFWDLPYLKALHLHHNAKLRFIDAHAFIKVPNLRILSLHANNLSAVSREVVRGFAKPVQVSLYENPLLCDCNVKWIHEMANVNSNRVRILKAERMLCDRPPSLHRTPLKTLNRTLIPDNCPPVLVGPANLTVDKKIGDKHVFQCRAHGIPVPNVHWILPNGAVLNQTSNDIHFHLNSPGSLGIYHLKPKDSGTYTCQAENFLGEAISLTHLTVENIDINLFPLGVASTFVTVVWNGTARNAFPEYEIVYRKENGAKKEYQSVTVSQFFRSYTINNLEPRSRYKFCIGVKSKEDKQYVRFSCMWVQTRDESFMLQGIHHTSNVAVAAVLGIVTTMSVVVCVLLVVARKYRQRYYDTPEKSLVSNMAQIPMENLHSPLVSQAGL